MQNAKLSKALKIVSNDLKKTRLKFEKVAVGSVKKALVRTNEYASKELADLTGYKTQKVKVNNRVLQPKLISGIVEGTIVFKNLRRLGVLSLKGTRVRRGSGPGKTGSPGRISFNILGKKVTRKAIKIRVGSNTLAVSNTKENGKFKKVKGPRGARRVKSGRHAGKKYQTQSVYKLVGPDIRRAFESDVFQNDIDVFAKKNILKIIIEDLRKKGIIE